MTLKSVFDKGLVYRKNSPQNWCPDCHTVARPDGHAYPLTTRRPAAGA